MEYGRHIFFSEGNVEVDEKRIYMPIYMIMFLENTEINKFVYKIGLKWNVIKKANVRFIPVSTDIDDSLQHFQVR